MFASTVSSGPVTNLLPRNVTPTIVELSWGPVNEREQNGIILSYNIYYRLLNSSDSYVMIYGVVGQVSEYVPNASVINGA